MSTLSTDRLPATAPAPAILTLSRDGELIIQATTTGIQLDVDVITYGLAGRPATLDLFDATVSAAAYPYQSPPLALLRQSFTLVNGRQSHTFLITPGMFPPAGPLGPYARLELRCGSRVKSSGRFLLQQATVCDGGEGLEPVFDTNKGGPQYGGSADMAPGLYPDWNTLLQTSQVTAEERLILLAVAPNEGQMDAVQAWDNQLLSTGCIQKTITRSGGGELPEQLWRFKDAEAVRFACLVGNHGWDVTQSGNTYRVTYTEGNKVYRNQDLHDHIIAAHQKAKIDKNGYRKNRVLDPLVRLGRDRAFQQVQLLDAVKRIREVLALHPAGLDDNKLYNTDPKYRRPQPISEYLRTDVGRAIAFDQSANRPEHPPYYLGAALDKFLDPKNWPSGQPPSDDPTRWGKDREAYEHKLTNIYAGSRGNRMTVFINSIGKKGPFKSMTDPEDRYKRVRNFFAKRENLDWLPEVIVEK